MRPVIAIPGRGGDPLRICGERFDAAAAELDRLCAASAPSPDEAVFGRIETEFLAAREEYRRLVAERLGDDSEAIARRLAL
jgi:hypothetical protein